LDLEYRKSWDSYALEIEKIHSNGKSDIIYWQCKFPFPLQNRDYLYERVHKIIDDHYFLLSRGIEHEDKPEHKKFVRVDDYNVSMIMKPHEKEHTKFGIHYFDDMKGSIPKVLINWVSKTAVPQFINQTAKVAREYPKEKLDKMRDSFRTN